MDLRLPPSGLLLDSLLGGLGTTAGSAGDTTIRTPTAEQLAAAIDAMTKGYMEYVILEDRGQFVQAAGEGGGPYALQHFPGGSDAMLEVTGGVDAETMRKVLEAYRRGDMGWRGALAWVPM
jgi:hypothetical protein